LKRSTKTTEVKEETTKLSNGPVAEESNIKKTKIPGSHRGRVQAPPGEKPLSEDRIFAYIVYIIGIGIYQGQLVAVGIEPTPTNNRLLAGVSKDLRSWYEYHSAIAPPDGK